MSFTCRSGDIEHRYELKIQHSSDMYEYVKYCSVCSVYVSKTYLRCPCCSSPLRCKSKRH